MNNTIYISGPMSGKFLYNIPVFLFAGIRLMLNGWKIISPALITFKECWKRKCLPSKINYQEWIDIDLKELKKADYIFMLKGWTKSKGACKEFNNFAYNKKYNDDLMFSQIDGYPKYKKDIDVNTTM